MRDSHRKIMGWLADIGAAEISLRHDSKHPRICFTFSGKPYEYVTAGSTGDASRGVSNAISDLRHILGLVKTVKRVGVRRRRKSFAEPPMPEIPSLTAGRDWKANLMLHPVTGATLAAGADPRHGGHSGATACSRLVR